MQVLKRKITVRCREDKKVKLLRITKEQRKREDKWLEIKLVYSLKTYQQTPSRSLSQNSDTTERKISLIYLPM